MLKDLTPTYLSVKIKEASFATQVQIELQKQDIPVLNPCLIPGIDSQDTNLLSTHFANQCYGLLAQAKSVIFLAVKLEFMTTTIMIVLSKLAGHMLKKSQFLHSYRLIHNKI